MVQKTVDQRKEIRRVLGGGTFHPNDASILKNQKPADYLTLKESLRNISLAEFLGKGTVAGANYLIPDKLYDTLIFYSKETDLVPLISADVAERWRGGDLKVAITYDNSYKPKAFASGGQLATETVATETATLTPKSFGIGIQIGQDLIEDANWSMVEWHTRQAAKAMGEYATDLALTVLKTAPDGIGTKNAITTATADTTIYTELFQAIDDLCEDKWVANTLLTGVEPLEHTILTDTNTTGVQYHLPIQMSMPTEGFDFKLLNLDVKIATDDQLHDSTDDEGAVWTTCVSVVFDRNNALLTGRKRWMQIGNYANPIADLFGAVVTGRQDSVSLYKDAICVITEKE